MSDSQTHISSPSTSNGSQGLFWSEPFYSAKVHRIQFGTSRLEAAVLARLDGKRPKLPRKLKKRVKSAEAKVKKLRDKISADIYKTLCTLSVPFVNDDATRTLVADSLKSSIEALPGASRVEVEEKDGNYSFRYSLRTVTPAVTKTFTLQKPEGMSDDEFKKLADTLADEMNKEVYDEPIRD